MPYRYLEEVAVADAAFEATGRTLEELFAAAADATMNLMVADLGSIAAREKRSISLAESGLDLLLVNFLQEILFYKDAERLFLRVEDLRIDRTDGAHRLEATVCGEEIDPQKHDLGVDVKAVTLHRLEVEKTGAGWRARVIVDV